MARNEDGFTLVEMLVVVVVMAILVAVAVGFSTSARVRAGDVAAKSNIDVAVPAFQAYNLDHGTFTGMTLAGLQSSYSKGVQGIEVVSAGASGYCVRSTVDGRSWFKNGPSSPITTTSCS
ncbi:MAG: prepilin-type N-terminal cleavage/methylation domain-containing protein [Gaiellaceae bacterium]